MSTRLKLTLAYDGTRYAGWQVQSSGTGVQELVERALSHLFSGSPRLHSSSRTDAGVHALGMVAHVDLDESPLRMELRKVPLAINARLPDDIRVVEARRVSEAFHARFDAIGKEYRYRVWNHPVMNPLLRTQAWHVPQKLDLPAMREAARCLVGRHDFRSLAANHTYHIADTVRTLHRLDLFRQGLSILFVIRGDGFLYKMCRGLVGTLVQTGQGRYGVDDVRRILEARDRRAGGMSAPAAGLVLCRVLYPRGAESLKRRRDDVDPTAFGTGRGAVENGGEE